MGHLLFNNNTQVVRALALVLQPHADAGEFIIYVRIWCRACGGVAKGTATTDHSKGLCLLGARVPLSIYTRLYILYIAFAK